MKKAKNLADLDLKLGTTAQNSELDPIPRSLGRASLSAENCQFFGYDLWQAYEVSFMTPSGKPAIYVMQFSYDSQSPFMVESKSLKLFLNAQNNRVFADVDEFGAWFTESIGQCVGAPVQVQFLEPGKMPSSLVLDGLCLDDFDPVAWDKPCDASLLTAEEGNPQTFTCYSHLLRTNCPVTNQPDWGSITIQGQGRLQPNPQTLLTYIISFRNHQGFHEACCETIYADLWQLLQPERLQVQCFYTRRGGIDINPLRSSHLDFEAKRGMVWRQ